MRLGLALGYWGRGPNPAHLELAREAERLGYRRFWVAEHHNIPGIASAAT
jgi:alkanesulfonate monooxygenase SsuD/methylene tetrahydromethanopterin reductase-like flavin-dependent oxidoreductase (luciferase family)